MTRNVKPSLEKKLDIEKIIGKILKASGLKFDEFLFRTSISLDAYRKMVDRGRLSKNAVENILAKFDVNPGLLDGEEDLTLSGKLTSVQDDGDNPEIPLGVNLDAQSRKLFAVASKTTEYAFLPKTILDGEYRIELKSALAEQTELRKEALAGYKKLVKKLEDEIADLRSGKIPITITAPQNTK